MTKYTTSGHVYADGQDACGINGPYYLAADVDAALAERDARIDELTKESERLRTNCAESATRKYADKLSMDRDILEADNHEKGERIAELEKALRAIRTIAAKEGL